MLPMACIFSSSSSTRRRLQCQRALLGKGHVLQGQEPQFSEPHCPLHCCAQALCYKDILIGWRVLQGVPWPLKHKEASAA